MTGAALSGKKYKAYPEYKESGVEWVGEIPSDWSMWKLAHAFNEIGSGTTPPTNNEKWFKGDVPWITTGELREKIITDTKKKLSPSTLKAFPTLKKYPVGSIAIAMYGATIGRLGIFGVEAATNQACCVMTTSTQLNNKYLFYWLWAFKEDIIRLSSGGGQPNINQEKVASLRVSAPKSKEQQKIASFLDHETAKIDTLIAKQEKLIELLKEKRQAVISHAVTKGLNPNAPMRDSGVEWLGEVPEHWEVMQFRRVTKLSQGLQIPQSERFYENGKNRAEYITIKSINAGEKSTYKEYIESKNSRVFCTKNEILLARTGATGEVITDVEGVFHNNFFKVSFNEKQINKNYLYKLLTAKELKSHLLMLAGTTTIPDLNHGAFLSTSVAIPPLNEQKKINAFILNKNDRYGLLMSKATNAIELMLERKTALISAAVTGKIDVRDWKPQGV
tara:strand:+ start:85 stop:1425 length:1341 start_codon:yes stop_codon:yes gene_type:complete